MSAPVPAEGRPLRIAVVGSGLAGLTAVWLLGRLGRVTVYEEHPTPGMGAHSVHVGPERTLVDVPLRVFTPAYYPQLVALYEKAGVRIDAVDYAASFSRPGGETWFRYRNVRVAGRSLPRIGPTQLVRPAPRAIARGLARLHRLGPRDLRTGRLDGLSLAEYLTARAFEKTFVEGFLLPAYATVCTCSLESVRRYPAELIVAYACSGVTTLGVLRAGGGSAEVVRRLLEPAHDVRTSTPVARIRCSGDAVEVVDARGGRERFDHVVLASRADQGAALLEGDPALRSLLERVPHEESRVVVHTDPRLAPTDRRAWRPVNILASPASEAPMATIWLNRAQAGLGESPAIFQTWNPLVEPVPDSIVTEARVSRPVVTVGTRDVPKRLAALHEEPGRRIWPVGSYAEPGIPLLEAAAASATRVAQSLERRTLDARSGTGSR